MDEILEENKTYFIKKLMTSEKKPEKNSEKTSEGIKISPAQAQLNAFKAFKSGGFSNNAASQYSGNSGRSGGGNTPRKKSSGRKR